MTNGVSFLVLALSSRNCRPSFCAQLVSSSGNCGPPKHQIH